MMKQLIVFRCESWNGKDKVCDSSRCFDLSKCFSGGHITDCYHKPFIVDGIRKTVVEAINELLGGVE
jgi:hypothetical protein